MFFGRRGGQINNLPTPKTTNLQAPCQPKNKPQSTQNTPQYFVIWKNCFFGARADEIFEIGLLVILGLVEVVLLFLVDGEDTWRRI